MYDKVKKIRKQMMSSKTSGNLGDYDLRKLELDLAIRHYKMDPLTFYTNHQYDNQIKKRRINKLTNGGNGRVALIEWLSLPDEIRKEIVAHFGAPEKRLKNAGFVKYLEFDNKALSYFKEFKKSDHEGLTPSQINKWVAQANVFNAVTRILDEHHRDKRAFGKGVLTLWKNISIAINELNPQILEKYPHGLGSNWKRLRQKYEKYDENGYESLLHSGINNDNSKKIKGENADWILASYCQPNKPSAALVLTKYNVKALKNGWPTLTLGAITKWLNMPENKRLWRLARDGREAYNNEFGYHIKRDRESLFPNSWWAIDGSKLDWTHLYDNQMNMAAKLKIDVVIDVFSEKILGWSLSTSETYIDHFKALKMAVNNSGCRPYLINYDNQSGHKAKKMQDLYSSIVAKNGGVHLPNKAKRHSNVIEQIFGRLQQQVLNQLWFSDKQSIKAKSRSNQVNVDFLLENKNRLYDTKQLNKAWELCVNLWNEASHPKHKNLSRNEVYIKETPMKEEFGFMDQVNTFWINETRAKRYYKGGMPLTVNGVKFEYEVYNSSGEIDLEFRRKYIGAKFIVKYDPEHLNNFIQLWKEDQDGNRTFIANAEPKRKHKQVPVLMNAGDKSKFLKDFGVVDQELQRDLAAINNLRVKTGITPDKLIEETDLAIKLGGNLDKETRNKVESKMAWANGL